uniref:Uncharacterized protein n=1 Tax=Wolbachia endosymbiont of Aleurodicus floccissimus TaxID=2152762 RepID=A0A3B0JGP4_9RICK
MMEVELNKYVNGNTLDLNSLHIKNLVLRCN